METNLSTKQKLKITGFSLLFFSIFEVLGFFSTQLIYALALYPREVHGMTGILTSVFVHKDLHHFATNMLTFAILNFLLLGEGFKRYSIIMLGVVFGTGLLVWFFARSGAHVGASGVIYGLFGYLVVHGFVSRRWDAFFISCLLIFIYGGLFWGVLPVAGFISWESHLFGLIIGVLLAWQFRAKSSHTPLPR
ncbi:rhomboid family intramembrane serine protease [Glaciecola sp. 1036]|uniref:rhomboid family intramembrane serine protease n=1 Tax=Alteromonadaceae TaxID=72275 RepID=UPI003D0431FA